MLSLIRLKYLRNIYPEYNRENIKKWKKAVYELNLKEEDKNQVWEYLNEDKQKYVLSKRKISLIMNKLKNF